MIKHIALLAILFGYAACNDCGVQNPNGQRSKRSAADDDDNPNPYIIGGWQAKPGENPFQVFLTMQTSQGGMSCGGSLISSTCVLTAGHCVYGCSQMGATLASSVTVYLGALTTRPMDAREQITVQQRNIRPHPSYRACTSNMKNDIAIIRLPQPVQMGMTSNGYKSVGTVCMPTTDRFQTAYVSGWGRTSSSNQNPSNILKIADMNYVGQQNCGGTDSSQICVSHPRNSGCNGDSGGPLYTTNTGRAHVIGVVSYGVRDCYPGRPSVFTNVKFFESWIRSICPNI